MKTATIEDIVYHLKELDKDAPKPIVFLGAGASKSGRIPLAYEIRDHILSKFAEKPDIKELPDASRTYANLMDCLLPSQRNTLLKGYIDEAKINVTHLCLAQLMMADYIDYVLTVNFDNLMQRALALHNYFPPTYDMAILKDLTTTRFTEKSVVFLHGSHHGLWLLNTDSEMRKVEKVIPDILRPILHGRPWIFIGYSGEDPIFEHIAQLGRFDDHLYWVTYYDNDPSEKVCKGLLDNELKNCAIIKGYDADSFMLTLNTKLGLPQPQILERPFTTLLETLKNIVDIEDEEPYIEVKERLEIDKEYVELAIKRFEENDKNITTNEIKVIVDVGSLKKQIIDVIVNTSYEAKHMAEFVEKAKQLNSVEINETLAVAFNNWGNALYATAELKNDEVLYIASFEKYEQATRIAPLYARTFNNWGNAFSSLAKLKNDEALFAASFEKYEYATSINPDYAIAFSNWGSALSDLARLKNEEALFVASFEKYKQAINIAPQNAGVFNNWGTALSALANLRDDKALYNEAINKCQQAIALGEESYNLACCYALMNDKIRALETLEFCFKNKEITTTFVKQDTDWENYWQDPDFLNLIDQYKEA